MKNRILTRITAMVLCIVMFTSVVPFGALAETAENTDVTTGEVTDPDITDEGNPDVEEEEDLYAEATEVYDTEGLEEALELGASAIKIMADFLIDRTFYITSDTIIFSEEAHTLTRAPEFSGDIFVVGEYSDGTAVEEGAELWMGHHESEETGLLVIDGNKDNMTANVTGTVFFVRSGSSAVLYHNLTVQNCKKVGNERALLDAYGLSYSEQVGGAVAIVAGGTLTVYGGTYSHNAVNNESDDLSSRGGVFYLFGDATIYGGTFEDNHAYRAGAFYSYRTLSMYGGTVKGNTAYGPGGAVYMPASTAAYIVIDGDEDEGSWVTFQNNSSGAAGGAIYAAGVSLNVDTAVFSGNEADTNGGGVHFNGCDGYFENVTFDGNVVKSAGTDYGGGALHVYKSYVEINGAEIKNNTSAQNGGGILARETSEVVMNEITASSNVATKSGGFVLATESAVRLYSSSVYGNSANQGGGIYLSADATLHAYLSNFDSNSSTSNGGALFVYTGAVESLLHSCVFLDNTSGNYGGGMYVSSASILTTYNLTAKNNQAVKGGFMYHTTTNTTVTLNGLMVEGNTATEGGPIIWGNLAYAILYINKDTYYDVDATTAYDDEYWSYAIANKLTVYETTDPVPGFVNYGDTEETPPEKIVNPNVTNIVELQRALNAGLGKITIISDIKLDRTLYISHNTTMTVSGNRTFTRNPVFGGDLFVIGENSDGTICEEDVTVTIKTLDENSSLTIDGNKDNMTADVTGTVFFITSAGLLELNEGITVKNCNKVGNERTANESYGLSYTDEIGGPVAIVAGGQLDIYGGTYTDNCVNDETEESATSTRGGVIYSFGTVNIYGGTFTNNHAHRAGVFYAYGKMSIHNALIESNTAAVGGAIYVPASTGAYLYVGTASYKSDPYVIFKGNSCDGAGGAIYASGRRLQIENASFIGNTSNLYGGAVYLNPTDELATATTPGLIIKDSVFEENTSTRGGAVYITGALVSVQNTEFTRNHSTGTNYGGGAVYSTGSKSVFEGVRFIENVSDYNGGGIALYGESDATLYNVTADGNTAAGYGGFIYSNSALKTYNSTIKNNEATKQGGALYLTAGSTTAVYSTDFIGNKANGGGAVRFCNGSDGNLLQDCRFIGNSSTYYGGAIYINAATTIQMYNITATNNHGTHGGFIYQTTAGSSLTINGLTVSGNTDDNGGPTIWGNTYNAKLYINKANYTDLDYTGEYDDAYWAKAIYNKLTVNEISDAIPEADEYGDEDYSNITDYVEVSSADELEEALLNEKPYIRVVSDIVADRTFYVTADTTLFATTPYRITRATDFGGDILVVGEYQNGRSVLLDKLPPVLTLGNPESTTEDLLIIDGNKNNMTVPVVGSLLMMVNSAQVNMYANTSFVNAHKSGNERVLDETKYALTTTRHKIGGSAVLLESGTLNIYGGNIRNNSINNETTATETDDGLTSTFGSAIYNQGALNIYGGTFEHNKGARGGVVYNYKMMHVYGGTFENNYASRLGGVFYLPSSANVQLYIGDATGESDKTVICSGNASYSGGGVIYNGVYASTIIYGNAEFSDNRSIKSNGGVVYASGVLIAKNSTFENNKAYSKGGALYVFNSKNEFSNSKVVLENCTFTENTARSSGGAVYATSSTSSLEFGSEVVVTDCAFTGNTVNNGMAPTLSGGNGGAISISNKSNVTINNTPFKNNSTGTEGGAIYVALESTLNLTDCEFTGNTATNETKSYAGAVSVHSSFVNAERVTFTENSAVSRAGALYNSYNGASTYDSIVTLRDCDFVGNYAKSYGGAIYSIDRNRNAGTEEEPERERGLFVFDTTFTENSTGGRGGAIYMTGFNNAYMQSVEFTGNQAVLDEESNSYGGAIYMTGKNIMEINGGTFTENTADVVGGIGLYSGSSVILNKVTAVGNTATESYGGFLACDTASATLYDCVMQNNSSGTAGGAIYTVDLTGLSAYNCKFEGNSAGSSGGAVHVYTGESSTVLHSCEFLRNTAVVFGGAVNISGSSLLDMYNITAKNNTAGKGGFMYETKAGTVVNLNGITLSSNTATEGGPIIWGNTLNAKLYINKANYNDLDYTGEYDDAYWTSAIYNLLTVGDLEGEIPAVGEYECSYEEEVVTVLTYKEVDVDKIFELSENSSEEAINSTYGNLPKLDNSSNFMSKNTAVYENINGGTVTADTFVSYKGSVEGNGNFGEGLLIFQAMQYKKAYPEENVKISLATYRFSAATAICINRESRYFGYMRALHTEDYDQYGFVRIAYLLKAAAAMGIEVTVTTQRNGYPNTPYTPMVPEYFTEELSAPCDSDYAQGKVLGDYLNFVMCEWSLIGKGGSDMMHTKACAVSHYLDKDGVAHKNATWLSSTNLDGVNANGTNGNNTLQTSTIISDHEDIYRVTVNHINFITQYCGYEEVYLFRDLAIKRSTEQIDLILAGRGAEIPSDEQIVYLGSENDDVFELYFTPMGGEMSNWDEEHNPYSKYLRKLSNSDDSIQVLWNCVTFTAYSLRNQMQDMIIDAFHKNADPDNKIYLNLPTFNTDAFNDLTVGEDIGYTSFNKKEFGGIHTKDLSLSYSESGQRYYVSLLNSMNTHAGSIGYQTNFALVIKETELTEDSVYFTIADLTSTGMVEHAYGEEQTYLPDSADEDGYSYHACAECGKIKVTGVVHRPGTWTIDKKATVLSHGVAHKNCQACGLLLETREYSVSEEEIAAEVPETSGKTFTQSVSSMESAEVTSTPLTLEAVIKVPKTYSDRGGVIVGNYDKNSLNRLNLEIYTFGKVRLFYTTNGESVDIIFNTDIRSGDRRHIAVTIDGLTATLYVDGMKTETAVLPIEAPTLSGEFKIGGDNRDYNVQYFKGTIYSVNLFSDVRTEDEIKRDAVIVFPDSEGLMVSKNFEATGNLVEAVMPHGNTFTSENAHSVEALGAAPRTIEAIVQIPKTYSDRAGVIFGNYDGKSDGINLEVYNEGKIRLYVKNGTDATTYLFNTDIRSDDPVHIALTIDSLTATLYLNGEATESIPLLFEASDTSENYKIGGDNREGNTQYFKGRIYSVNLFSDVRSEEEIKTDIVTVSRETDGFLYSKAFVVGNDLSSVKVTEGIKFKHYVNYPVDTLSATPHTIEAVIEVPKTYTGRAGVIVGNYDKNSANRLNLEIYTEGRVRLFYTDNGVNGDCIFDTDIRSDEPVHIAVVVDGLTARLYVDGEIKEEKALDSELGEALENFKLGGDNRLLNTQFFKGTLYSVNLFSDARSEEEVKADSVSVAADADGLIYSKRFINKTEMETIAVTPGGKTFDEDKLLDIGKNLSATPHTIEAVIKVDETVEGSAGVIIGNNNGQKRAQMNLEIADGGKVRLYYMAVNGVKTDCKFSTDIRSDDPVHIAVTIVDRTANLYINGALTETKKLNYGPGKIIDSWKIGGDNREGNTEYFKGTIYSVNMFSDVRTEEEIKKDIISPDILDSDILYSAMFDETSCDGDNHIASDWIYDYDASDTANGISHKECVNCGKILECYKTPRVTEVNDHRVYENASGFKPEEKRGGDKISTSFSATPHTFEATIQLSKDYSYRGGVIMGNYDAVSKNAVNIDIYTYGKPRIYYVVNGTGYSYTFKTDIRSDSMTHIAITVDGLNAKLYVNGALKEEGTLKVALPEATEGFIVGADGRKSGPQYFKGTIYTAAMFSDVRTAEEIAVDRYLPASDSDGLLFSKSYLTAE